MVAPGGAVLATGTGFWVVGGQGPFLATARHNMTGRHADTGEWIHPESSVAPTTLRLYLQSSSEEALDVREVPLVDREGCPLWWEHPCLGAAADVALLPIEETDFRFWPYDLGDTLPDEPRGDGLRVAQGDDAAVVGYPGLRGLGLTAALSARPASRRARRSAHDPGRVLRDVAVMLADGGDCVSDLAALRDQPELFGEVASHATAWRTLDAVAADELGGVDAIRAARKAARAKAWQRAGVPLVDGMLVVDIDATHVTAHSDKQRAAGTYKAGSGSIRCCRSLTTVTAPASRWPASCVRATPGPTPWSTTTTCSR